MLLVEPAQEEKESVLGREEVDQNHNEHSGVVDYTHVAHLGLLEQDTDLHLRRVLSEIRTHALLQVVLHSVFKVTLFNVSLDASTQIVPELGSRILELNPAVLIRLANLYF